jgi:hypothetical protein
MTDQVYNLIHYLAAITERQLAISRLQYYQSLRANAAIQSSKSLIAFGQKIYSQNEEDGIILEIFNRIGTTNRVFVEFGVENGLECNTRALLFCGWRGLWIDSNVQHVKSMKQQLPNTINTGQLSVLLAHITMDNINELISSKITEKEIDFLSIDIDGNDYHILSAITCIKPRVIVIEYNAKFPPPIQYCQQYNEQHRWDGTDDFGASIDFLDEKLNEMGYKLVACNLTGSNAFFVREELVEDKFHEPCNAKHHYQPARYFLQGLTSGHPASNDTIEKAIK